MGHSIVARSEKYENQQDRPESELELLLIYWKMVREVAQNPRKRNAFIFSNFI